ncbi:alpha/beta fold hydrolase [Robertmurraya kyonggiensis]|uniref:Alpha/beta hydrolase n=1 Tax=Robertmurraya kyonggiensis TaxID=1037680 RepID=A0A4U1D1K5_9BACI|nr:alpha/beta hydrolase [Robertmurraya kyonggiensis]TKC14906.1 alpha/beta hydrolase [Robertmurraya kyonggiensis]
MVEAKHIHIDDGVKLEYSVVGNGIPILVFHGGHSNCNEEFGYEKLIAEGFSVITPSRAGYGDTSPIIGGNLNLACKAYVKLLDYLSIEKVDVIAISAGGPSGIYFASHYPERVKSLILQSAVSKEWLTSADNTYKAAQIMFRPSVEKYTWRLVGLMSNLFPRFIFKQMAPSFSRLSISQILTQLSDDDYDTFRKMNNRQRSGSGFLIDLSQTSSISVSDLQAIKCPTLIIHSEHDNAVLIEHAYHAHKHIPNSKLSILDSWGHLIWLGKGFDEWHKEMIQFLK